MGDHEAFTTFWNREYRGKHRLGIMNRSWGMDLMGEYYAVPRRRGVKPSEPDELEADKEV